MENNILQKVREDISAYLDSYKLDKYYRMYGFGYADGDEFERMLLLTEADVNFILEHRQDDNDPIFHVKLCETIIPFQDKINKLVETKFRYEEAWGIDLSNFSFPLTFTISEIEAPCSLPKNTEQQIIITKEELERILFATAKFWLGGDRQSAYRVLYESLSKYVIGIFMPYVIFCESIDSILASIIGPYKIQE